MQANNAFHKALALHLAVKEAEAARDKELEILATNYAERQGWKIDDAVIVRRGKYHKHGKIVGFELPQDRLFAWIKAIGIWAAFFDADKVLETLVKAKVEMVTGKSKIKKFWISQLNKE